MDVLGKVLFLVYCGVCLSKTVPVQVPDIEVNPAPEDKSQNVGQPPSDPFVQDEEPLLESLVGAYKLDAVNEMTASVTNPIALNCDRERSVKLDGNMDCLISYWNFQPFTDVNYTRFASLQRSECDYIIGYEQCYPPQEAEDIDLTVTSDANALVDGDPNTVWAGRITPGVDTETVIELDAVYEVIAMDFLAESVPIDVSVQLQLGYNPPFTVTRVKQTCKPEDGTFCRDFLLMDRKYHGLDWLDEAESSEALSADKVIVTLHGKATFGSYSTNYHIIRDIRLLAKPTKLHKIRKSNAEVRRQLRLQQRQMQMKRAEMENW